MTECLCFLIAVLVWMGVATMGFELGWWPDESCIVCPPDYFAAEATRICLREAKGNFLYDTTTGTETLVQAECPAGFVVARDSYTCGSFSSKYRCLDFKNSTTAIGKTKCKDTVWWLHLVSVLFYFSLICILITYMIDRWCRPVAAVVSAETVVSAESKA